MVALGIIGSIVLKVVKLVINLIILIIYRIGYGGYFLGIGGTWNLNEEKSADSEIIASGIFVIFFIYTSVQLITYCFGSAANKRELSDTIMNVIGVLVWLGVGGTALHYWSGYVSPLDTSERIAGIIVGVLSILSSLLYIVDTVITFVHFAKDQQEKY